MIKLDLIRYTGTTRSQRSTRLTPRSQDETDGTSDNPPSLFCEYTCVNRSVSLKVMTSATKEKDPMGFRGSDRGHNQTKV